MPLDHQGIIKNWKTLVPQYSDYFRFLLGVLEPTVPVTSDLDQVQCEVRVDISESVDYALCALPNPRADPIRGASNPNYPTLILLDVVLS